MAATALAALFFASERVAFAQGIISTASTAGGDQDANVGLDNTKTYFNAINVNGGNLTINGVNFTGNNGDATWTYGNFPNPLVSENASSITGQFGTLEDSFRYGNVPAVQTVTLTGLTAGQTYITTFYNPNWDFGNSTARTSQISTTSGATFSYNQNPGAALAMSILRYSFVASGANETVSFNNTGAAGSTHLYGFTTEQAFNNNWTSGANWSTAAWSVSTPNAVGDNANFGAQGSPTNINVDVPVTLGHLHLTGANAWTVSGLNTLTLQPDVGGVSVLSTPTGSHTISASIAGSNPIIKVGAGTLTLSGNNTFTGVMNLAGGVLDIGSTNALGSTAGGTVQSGSSELRISGGIVTAAEPLQINGGGISNAGALRNISGNNTYSGTVTLTAQSRINSDSGTLTLNNATAVTGTNQNLVVGGAGNVIISGAITTGTGFISKDGAGTLTLSGANTFSGLVTVNAGTLEFKTIANGSPSSLGTGSSSAPNGRIVIGNGDLKFTGTTTQIVDRNIAWEAGATGALDASGAPGAALVINDSAANPFNNPGARTFTFSGTNTDANTYSGALANQAASVSSVTKKGTGRWVLSGTNTYSGTTIFEGGVLNVAALSNYGVSGSLGNRASSSDVPTNIGLLFRGGTLQYTGSTATSTDRAIRVSTTGGAFLDASGTSPSATMSFTRTTASPDFFENGGARQITFTGTNTGENTFAMPIQSTGGLTTVNKTGPGRWILSGASTYSGPTNIQAGILQIENSTALGAGTFSVNDWTVITNGAALHLKGNLAVTEHFRLQGNGADGLGAIRSLSGTSSISQNMGLDGTTQFGVDPGSQLTIVNTIYAAVVTPGLTKSGGGTLVLSGNNTYTGTTTVVANGGELIINGNTSGQGNYFVNSGSRLGGNGSIGLASGNSVWISGSPGELSPGYASTGPFSGESYSAGADINTVGSLGVVGDVDLGGSLLIDLMNSDQDQLNVVGDFAILTGPNALLEINGTTNLGSVDFWGILGWTTVGQSIDLVTFSTFGGGTFANVPFNEQFTDAGGRHVILGLDGDSIFLVSTPEPASILVWSLIGFSVIGCVRNCAKRKR